MSEALKNSLLGVIEQIKQKPEAAKAVFRADTELVKNVECRAQIREFPAMTIDEPPILGGTDKGANPVELLLAALGTCQEIMYGAYASVMGVKLDQVKVEVKGYLDLRGLFGMDPSIPSGYSKIQYKTTIKSPADEATLKNLVATVEGHCPVLDTLTRAVEVTGEVSCNGKQIH